MMLLLNVSERGAPSIENVSIRKMTFADRNCTD